MRLHSRVLNAREEQALLCANSIPEGEDGISVRAVIRGWWRAIPAATAAGARDACAPNRLSEAGEMVIKEFLFLNFGRVRKKKSQICAIARASIALQIHRAFGKRSKGF